MPFYDFFSGTPNFFGPSCFEAALVYNIISSVVEFQGWWVLKSKFLTKDQHPHFVSTTMNYSLPKSAKITIAILEPLYFLKVSSIFDKLMLIGFTK